MTALQFQLPDLPQVKTLRGVIERLSTRPDVLAIWLGGSFATGIADCYSDVDLRLAVTPEAFSDWVQMDLEWIFLDKCSGKLTLAQGNENVLHHLVLSDGESFDLYVQPFPPSFIESDIVVLAVKDSEMQKVIEAKRSNDEDSQATASPEAIQRAINDFWIHSHKHRKVLDRDLDLLAHYGLNAEKDTLRRLWYVSLTGNDEQGRKTIHTLTSQTRAITEGIDGHAFKLLGMPLQSRSELIEAIEAIRHEVSKVGRDLAAKLDFKYPSELEEVVRKSWREWCPPT